MPASRVSDPELCWVVAALQPASVKDIASRLPIGESATYNRLRYLARAGLLERDEAGRQHTYRVSAAGRTRIELADLPPAADVDFVDYFADRETDVDADVVLETLASFEDEWAITPQIVDRLPVSATMVRNYLHRLVDVGAIEVDQSGEPYKWRLTEAGTARLGDETESDQGQLA